MGKNAQSQGLCLTVFAFCLLFLGFRSIFFFCFLFSCFPFYFLGRLNRFRYLRVWMSTIVSLSIMSPSCDFILIPPLGVDRPFFVFILFLFYLSCQEIPTN